MRHPIVGHCFMLVSASLCWSTACTACGHPYWAKISSDSKRVMYEDCRHERVYLYHTDTSRMEVFNGGLACVNRDMTRFVLLPMTLHEFTGSAKPVNCSLGTIETGKTVVSALESLPPGHLRAMFFCIEQEMIQAVIGDVGEHVRELGRRPVTGENRFLIHKSDGGGWVPGMCPCTEEKMRQQDGRPVGILDGGHVYYFQSSAPPAFRSGSDWGRDVEECFPKTGELELRLRSPDNTFLVRIDDLDDPLRRLTLTNLRTNKKTILLDKNDAALDMLEMTEKVLQLPIRLLLLGRPGA